MSTKNAERNGGRIDMGVPLHNKKACSNEQAGNESFQSRQV
jgi:hypothetical protein